MSKAPFGDGAKAQELDDAALSSIVGSLSLDDDDDGPPLTLPRHGGGGGGSGGGQRPPPGLFDNLPPFPRSVEDPFGPSPLGAATSGRPLPPVGGGRRPSEGPRFLRPHEPRQPNPMPSAPPQNEGAAPHRPRNVLDIFAQLPPPTHTGSSGQGMSTGGALPNGHPPNGATGGAPDDVFDGAFPPFGSSPSSGTRSASRFDFAGGPRGPPRGPPVDLRGPPLDRLMPKDVRRMPRDAAGFPPLDAKGRALPPDFPLYPSPSPRGGFLKPLPPQNSRPNPSHTAPSATSSAAPSGTATPIPDARSTPAKADARRSVMKELPPSQTQGGGTPRGSHQMPPDYFLRGGGPVPPGASGQRLRTDSFPSEPHFDSGFFPPSPRAGPQGAHHSLSTFPPVPSQHPSRRGSEHGGRHMSSSFGGDVPPPHMRSTPPSGPLPQPFSNVNPTPPHTHPLPSPHNHPMNNPQLAPPRSFPGSSPSSAPLPSPGGGGAPAPQALPSPHLQAQHARTRQLSKEDIGGGNSGRSSSNSSPGSESARDRRSRNHIRFYMPLPRHRFQHISHQEIELVLRQQLHHIQSPDPMSDDFYAQVANARRGGKWKGVGVPALGSVRIHNLKILKHFRNPDGSPRLPDGTLGKISAPTIRRMRTLLSLAGAQIETGPDHRNKKKKKRFCQDRQKRREGEKEKESADDDGGEKKKTDKDTDGEDATDTEDDDEDDDEEEAERAAAAEEAEQLRKVAAEKAAVQAKLDAARYGGEPPRGNMFRNRSLAYLIEQGYRNLMKIENIDSSISTLRQQNPHESIPLNVKDEKTPEQRHEEDLDFLTKQHHALVDLLLQSLDVSSFEDVPADAPLASLPDHLLYKFAPVGKGRLLVLRSIMLTPASQNFVLLRIVCSRVVLFALPKEFRDFDIELGGGIARPIYKYPFPQVLVLFHAFTASLTHDNCSAMVRSRVGAALLRAFLKRGDPGTMAPNDAGQVRHLATWRGIFNVIAALLQTKMSRIVIPPADPAEKENEQGENQNGKEKGGAASSGGGGGESKDAASKSGTRKTEDASQVNKSGRTPPGQGQGTASAATGAGAGDSPSAAAAEAAEPELTASGQPRVKDEEKTRIGASPALLWEVAADVFAHGSPRNRAVIARDALFWKYVHLAAPIFPPARFLSTLPEAQEHRPPGWPPAGPPPAVVAPPAGAGALPPAGAAEPRRGPPLPVGPDGRPLPPLGPDGRPLPPLGPDGRPLPSLGPSELPPPGRGAFPPLGPDGRPLPPLGPDGRPLPPPGGKEHLPLGPDGRPLPHGDGPPFPPFGGPPDDGFGVSPPFGPYGPPSLDGRDPLPRHSRFPDEHAEPPSALDQFIQHANAAAGGAPGLADRRNGGGPLPPAGASTEPERILRRPRANSGAVLPPGPDGALPLPSGSGSGMHSPRNGPLGSPHHGPQRADQRGPPGLGAAPYRSYNSRPLPPYESRDSRRLSEAQHLAYMRERMPRQQEHRHSLPMSPPGGPSSRARPGPPPADSVFPLPPPGAGAPRKDRDAAADFRMLPPPNQGQGRSRGIAPPTSAEFGAPR